jgi:C4-dicarboxylate-specific signal transduction histidine kinase
LSKELTDIVNDVPFLVYCFDSNMIVQHVFGKIANELQINKAAVLGVSLQRAKMMMPVSVNHARQALRGESFTAVLEFKKKVFEVVYQPKLNGDRVAAVVCTASDVSARVEAERELLERETKLAMHSRLSGLGKIAGGMAHEINNPLSIVLGNCQLLVTMLTAPALDRDQLSGRVAKVQKNAERVAKIVSSLLSIFKGDRTDAMTSLNLPQIINVAVESNKDRISTAGIAITYEGHEGDPSASGNSKQLLLVISSLLSNSIDAIRKSDQKWIKIHSQSIETETRVTITDSGNGIPPEIRLTIFDPFFTTKEVNEGTGLGLSLVKQIMEHHGGNLHLDERAKNTSFVLTFPKPEKDKLSISA